MSSPNQPMHITLPFELIMLILETTVTIFPGTALTMAIVSRDAKPWIDSVLYGNIVLRSPIQASLLHETIKIRTSADPTFFSRTVRALSVLSGTIDPAMVASIMTACSGISSLSIGLHATTPNIRDVLPSFRCLRNLCIFFLDSHPSTFDGLVSKFPPTLERIIVDSLAPPIRPDFWASLSQMASITHVLWHHWLYAPSELPEQAERLRGILREFTPDSALRVFIILATIRSSSPTWPVAELEMLKEIDDRRLVAFLTDGRYCTFDPNSSPLPMKSLQGFLAMSRWDSSSTDYEDLWVTAEKVISSRQLKIEERQ